MASNKDLLLNVSLELVKNGTHSSMGALVRDAKKLLEMVDEECGINSEEIGSEELKAAYTEQARHVDHLTILLTKVANEVKMEYPLGTAVAKIARGEDPIEVSEWLNKNE
jgi:hypothetical protein